MSAAILLEGILIWMVAGSYFGGMILAYRLRFHLDLSKLADPANAEHSIKHIAFPPADILTVEGRKRRKVVIWLWGISAIAFLILVVWKVFE